MGSGEVVGSVEDSPTLNLQRVQRPRQRLKKEKEIQQNAPYSCKETLLVIRYRFD